MGILWSIGFANGRSRVSRVSDERDNCALIPRAPFRKLAPL